MLTKFPASGWSCYKTSIHNILETHISYSNDSQDQATQIPRRGRFSVNDWTSQGNSIINERSEQMWGRIVQVAALGVFGYASFSIIAGCLGDYRKPPNLVVMVTGIISIVQVPTLSHYLASLASDTSHPSSSITYSLKFKLLFLKVILQLLFIQDVARRRISSADQVKDISF